MGKILTKVLVVITALTISFGVIAKGPPEKTVLLKDANGIIVGRVIGMRVITRPYVLTDEGYRTIINIHSGDVYLNDAAGFTKVECMGNAYIGADYLGTVYTLRGTGDSYELFYTPYDEPHVSVTIYSVQATPDSCYNLEPPFEVDAVPITENDPDVTGIENEIYPTRMLIE